MTAPYVKFKMPEKLVEDVLNLVETARTTGKIKKGTNETTKAVEKEITKLIVIAEDISPPEIAMHLPLLCEERGIAYTYVPKKEELGASAGVEVGCGAVAIVEAGEGKTLLKEILEKLKEIKK